MDEVALSSVGDRTQRLVHGRHLLVPAELAQQVRKLARHPERHERSPRRSGSEEVRSPGARVPTIETERIEWRPGVSAEPLVVIALAELFAAL